MTLDNTYKDGIGMTRCLFCGLAKTWADGERVVVVSQNDVEEILCILVEYVDCPEFWGETIHRLEQALGYSYRQMSERIRSERLAEKGESA